MFVVVSPDPGVPLDCLAGLCGRPDSDFEAEMAPGRLAGLGGQPDPEAVSELEGMEDCACVLEVVEGPCAPDLEGATGPGAPDLEGVAGPCPLDLEVVAVVPCAPDPEGVAWALDDCFPDI